MQFRLLIAAFLSLLLAASLPARADDAPPAAAVPAEPKPDLTRPDGVLKELYTSYFATLNGGGKADVKDYAAKYFDPELASKYAAATNGEGKIDFDIFINAQDHAELTLGTIKRTLESPTHAIYDVHFTNNDNERKVRVGLVKAGDTWKVTDIDYGQGLSLSGMLK